MGESVGAMGGLCSADQDELVIILCRATS